jgi:putative protein kinase ArgK-like GTPase of G3E family
MPRIKDFSGFKKRYWKLKKRAKKRKKKVKEVPEMVATYPATQEGLEKLHKDYEKNWGMLVKNQGVQHIRKERQLNQREMQIRRELGDPYIKESEFIPKQKRSGERSIIDFLNKPASYLLTKDSSYDILYSIDNTNDWEYDSANNLQ